jgi:hypothetical protein
MESVLGILLILLIIAAGGGAVWLYFYMQKLRRQKLAEVAQQLGLTYYPGRTQGLHNRYGVFELFQRGDSHHSYDLISGYRDGIEVMIFDFSYTTGSGKNRTTHRRTVCVFELPTERHLPCVVIRPEGFFDKVASAIGFNDIDFESVEFSRKFFVKGKDRRFAYDLVHPRMMEYLLAVGSIYVEVANTAMLVHCDTRLSPDRWTGLFQKTEGFFRQIPERLLSPD